MAQKIKTSETGKEYIKRALIEREERFAEAERFRKEEQNEE